MPHGVSTTDEALTGAAETPLGNYAYNVSRRKNGRARATEEQRCRASARRAYTVADLERRRLRAVAQRLTEAQPDRGVSFGKCGRVPMSAGVIIRDTELAKHGPYRPLAVYGVEGQYAAFAGLVTCGSPWACPVCAGKIACKRAEEVRSVIARSRADGGEVYMLTLTTPHDQGDALRPLFNAVADSWRYCIQGRPWIEQKERPGFLGFIRGADDPTVGPNGWHPHLHVLLFFARPLAPDELEHLRGYFYRRWVKRIVERHGYRSPSLEHGVVLTRSGDGEYVAKLGLADELTGGPYKRARHGHRTPLQLLQDAARGEQNAARLWREYYAATFRRRRLTWSRRLRDRYLSNPEQDDADITAADEGVAGEARFEEPIPNGLWQTAIAKSPERQSELLRWGKRAGAFGVRLGLLWFEVESKLARLAGLGPYATIADVRAQLDRCASRSRRLFRAPELRNRLAGPRAAGTTARGSPRSYDPDPAQYSLHGLLRVMRVSSRGGVTRPTCCAGAVR